MHVTHNAHLLMWQATTEPHTARKIENLVYYLIGTLDTELCKCFCSNPKSYDLLLFKYTHWLNFDFSGPKIHRADSRWDSGIDRATILQSQAWNCFNSENLTSQIFFVNILFLTGFFCLLYRTWSLRYLFCQVWIINYTYRYKKIQEFKTRFDKGCLQEKTVYTFSRWMRLNLQRKPTSPVIKLLLILSRQMEE